MGKNYNLTKARLTQAGCELVEQYGNVLIYEHSGTLLAGSFVVKWGESATANWRAAADLEEARLFAGVPATSSVAIITTFVDPDLPDDADDVPVVNAVPQPVPAIRHIGN